jgi:hypothetical protein
MGDAEHGAIDAADYLDTEGRQVAYITVALESGDAVSCT